MIGSMKWLVLAATLVGGAASLAVGCTTPKPAPSTTGTTSESVGTGCCGFVQSKASCTLDTDCCSGKCDPGLKQCQCAAENGFCAVDSDCCPGFFCNATEQVGGQCTKVKLACATSVVPDNAQAGNLCGPACAAAEPDGGVAFDGVWNCEGNFAHSCSSGCTCECKRAATLACASQSIADNAHAGAACTSACAAAPPAGAFAFDGVWNCQGAFAASCNSGCSCQCAPTGS